MSRYKSVLLTEKTDYMSMVYSVYSGFRGSEREFFIQSERGLLVLRAMGIMRLGFSNSQHQPFVFYASQFDEVPERTALECHVSENNVPDLLEQIRPIDGIERLILWSFSELYPQHEDKWRMRYAATIPVLDVLPESMVYQDRARFPVRLLHQNGQPDAVYLRTSALFHDRSTTASCRFGWIGQAEMSQGWMPAYAKITAGGTATLWILSS